MSPRRIALGTAPAMQAVSAMIPSLWPRKSGLSTRGS